MNIFLVSNQHNILTSKTQQQRKLLVYTHNLLTAVQRRYVCNTGFCFLITAIFKSTILWINLMWCEMLRINPVFCEITTVDAEPKHRSYSKKTQQQRKLLV